jgi:hypothetical protein
MNNDPIMTEIRLVRHQLSEQCGHNPSQFVKFFQELEKQHLDRLVYFRFSSQSQKINDSLSI